MFQVKHVWKIINWGLSEISNVSPDPDYPVGALLPPSVCAQHISVCLIAKTGCCSGGVIKVCLRRRREISLERSSEVITPKKQDEENDDAQVGRVRRRRGSLRRRPRDRHRRVPHLPAHAGLRLRQGTYLDSRGAPRAKKALKNMKTEN